jgi:hypothetical protein
MKKGNTHASSIHWHGVCTLLSAPDSVPSEVQHSAKAASCPVICSVSDTAPADKHAPTALRVLSGPKQVHSSAILVRGAPISSHGRQETMDMTRAKTTLTISSHN